MGTSTTSRTLHNRQIRIRPRRLRLKQEWPWILVLISVALIISMTTYWFTERLLLLNYRFATRYEPKDEERQLFLMEREFQKAKERWYRSRHGSL